MTSREQADIFFKAGNYSEAIPLYRAAFKDTPDDHYCWQQLVLAHSALNEHDEAAEACKAALRFHTRSAWLWRQLGSEFCKMDRFEEAEKALGQSKRIDPKAEWLWRYYAELYKKQEKYAEEARALEELVELEKVSSMDLHHIGIAYYNANSYEKALAFYRMAAQKKPAFALYYNMGLAFKNSEVSQDVDAADAFRRAIKINPADEDTKGMLTAIKAKLGPLAGKALDQAKGVIRSNERYQYYLNPFEVLQIEPGPDELDIKVVQKAKKKLLQELDLNDGRVSWLDDQPLGRSRVLVIEEELDDVAKQNYHRLIYRNKPLLRFLTHGDIRHFVYSDDYFPEEELDLLDKDDGFRAFLSRPFATQYNAVLSRAIEKKALAVVEVLFDGRRWVEDADLDLCLGGAFKKVGRLVDVMSELEKESETYLVPIAEVQNALEAHGIVGLFNLLPAQFRTQQTQIVASIRSLAINCHNKHGRSEISKNILLLCKKFQFKSTELNERLKKDYCKIEELLAEQRSTSTAAPPPDSHRTTEPQPPPQSHQTEGQATDRSDSTGRMGTWIMVFGILVLVAILANTCASNSSSEHSGFSGPTVSEYPSPPPYKPNGEIKFPSGPSSIQATPAVPVLDDSWKAASYSNGEAPECFNYTPRYDRKLDNELRVTVGGGTDVVIKVMQSHTDRCIRYVYVRSQSTYSIRNIPQGQYYLKIAYGKRWVEKTEAGKCVGKFASSPLYKKGEDILDFRTRSKGTSYENGQEYENYEIPSFEIKLDVVTTGFDSSNLNTEGISEAEFNQ